MTNRIIYKSYDFPSIFHAIFEWPQVQGIHFSKRKIIGLINKYKKSHEGKIMWKAQ